MGYPGSMDTSAILTDRLTGICLSDCEVLTSSEAQVMHMSLCIAGRIPSGNTDCEQFMEISLLSKRSFTTVGMHCNGMFYPPIPYLGLPTSALKLFVLWSVYDAFFFMFSVKALSYLFN